MLRFVTDGLLDTIDSYCTGALPLHRFSWELHSRIDTLTELTDHRTLTRLHTLRHTVDTLDVTLRHTGREGLTAGEENTLTAALVGLRTILAQLHSTPTLTLVPALEPRCSA